MLLHTSADYHHSVEHLKRKRNFISNMSKHHLQNAKISKHCFYNRNSFYSKVRFQNIKHVTCPDLTFLKNNTVLRTQIKVNTKKNHKKYKIQYTKPLLENRNAFGFSI